MSETKNKRVIRDIDESVGFTLDNSKNFNTRHSVASTLVPDVVVPENQRPKKVQEGPPAPPLPPNAPPEILALLAKKNQNAAMDKSNPAHNKARLTEAQKNIIANMEKDDEIEEEVKSVTETDDDLIPARFEKSLDKTQVFAERIVPPSKCVPYDFDSIGIRPLDVVGLSAYAVACRRKDPTLVYDLLDRMLDVNIRDLWTIDVRYILFWLKYNSYNNVSHKIRWTSIYNNKNITEVKKTDVVMKLIDMTEAEYEGWYAKGLRLPTLRDQEELETKRSKLSEEDLWLTGFAQFVAGNSIEEKINTIKTEWSLDGMKIIRSFQEALVGVGLQEEVVVRDSHFKLLPAINQLRADVEVGEQEFLNLENTTEYNEKFVQVLENAVQKRRDELNRLLKFVDKNGNEITEGKAEPMLETQPLNISLFNLFPELL